MTTEKIRTQDKLRQHILEQTGEELITWQTILLYLNFLILDVKPEKACSPYEFCRRYYDKYSPERRANLNDKYHQLHLFLQKNSITGATTWEEITQWSEDQN